MKKLLFLLAMAGSLNLCAADTGDTFVRLTHDQPKGFIFYQTPPYSSPEHTPYSTFLIHEGGRYLQTRIPARFNPKKPIFLDFYKAPYTDQGKAEFTPAIEFKKKGEIFKISDYDNKDYTVEIGSEFEAGKNYQMIPNEWGETDYIILSEEDLERPEWQ